MLHCLHEHNALARSRTAAKLFSNIALLPYVPLSPHLMFVYRYLVLSHVYAAATSAPSAVQTCSTFFAPFPYNHDPCLWDENTQLHAYSNPQCLSIFHLQTCRTTADRYGRTSNWERYLEGQWIRNERGLAVGWVVWRRSYLSRNANAASSGPGPSESVESQVENAGGERVGSQSFW